MNRRAFLTASAATTAMGWREGRSCGRAAAGSIAGDALSRCPHRERLEATTTSFGEFSHCRYTIRAQLRADTLSIDHSAFRVAEAPSAPRFATLPAATRDKERC